MTAGVVIVGGGQAGFQVASSLRTGGYAGPVHLISAESAPPYQRPPLSKGLLLRKMDAGRLPFRQLNFYATSGIDLVLGETVSAIDRTARTVTTANGHQFRYDALVLTTGTRVRPLPVPGAELDGVVYLRTLEDSERLRERLEACRQAVVIGGGFIGLEVAAAARMLAKPVTVLEAAERLMGRVVAPVISQFYAELHRGRGVEVELGARIERLEGEGGRVQAVVMADGRRYPADLVVVGIGVLPNAELAAAAGIACENGILVDEHGRTSDPRVFAAGDCANHPNRYARGRIRLESVQNAIDQARSVAAAILGQDEPYDAVPWFWSDQYEVKLQMAGLSLGHDAQVVRGDVASGRFSVFYFAGGRLIAIDSVNRAGDHMAGRKLLAGGVAIDIDQAADESFDLKLVVGRAA